MEGRSSSWASLSWSKWSQPSFPKISSESLPLRTWIFKERCKDWSEDDRIKVETSQWNAMIVIVSSWHFCCIRTQPSSFDGLSKNWCLSHVISSIPCFPCVFQHTFRLAFPPVKSSTFDAVTPAIISTKKTKPQRGGFAAPETLALPSSETQTSSSSSSSWTQTTSTSTTTTTTTTTSSSSSSSSSPSSSSSSPAAAASSSSNINDLPQTLQELSPKPLLSSDQVA